MFRDLAETFLVGLRARPSGDDVYEELGRKPSMPLLLVGDKCVSSDAVSGDSGRSCGFFGVINPYRSTSAPLTSSQSSKPPASSNSPLAGLPCGCDEELADSGVLDPGICVRGGSAPSEGEGRFEGLECLL